MLFPTRFSKMNGTRGLLRRILFEMLGVLSLCGFFVGMTFGVVVAYDLNVFLGIGLILLSVLSLFSMDYWMDRK
jgi:hypothetical protein